MRVLNLGVIGVGNMGRHHARAYQELDESRLACVADTLEKRGKEIAKLYGAKFYKDYREMLEKEDIEALSIAVPTPLHYRVAMEGLLKDKHILVEKPIATSLKQAREIIEEAERRGVVLLTGHIERYNPAVEKVKGMIDKGILGKIVSILAVRVGLFSPGKREEDVITDLAIHDIGVCNFLLGRYPVSVYTKAGSALHSKKIDFASLFLDYEGTNVVIKVNWVTPVKIRRLSITGLKGYLELDYITQRIKFYETVYEKTFDSFGDFIIKFGEPGIRDVRVKFEEPLKLELKDFLGCIRDGGSPKVSRENVFKTLKIALLAKESYKKGRPLRIK